MPAALNNSALIQGLKKRRNAASRASGTMRNVTRGVMIILEKNPRNEK